jgi:hypothetical protein
MIDGPGVGVCPGRAPGLGHVWAGAMASGDRSNPCRYCGTSGRAFFAEATGGRAASFQRVKPTMESGTGKPERVRQEMDRREDAGKPEKVAR